MFTRKLLIPLFMLFVIAASSKISYSQEKKTDNTPSIVIPGDGNSSTNTGSTGTSYSGGSVQTQTAPGVNNEGSKYNNSNDKSNNEVIGYDGKGNKLSGSSDSNTRNYTDGKKDGSPVKQTKSKSKNKANTKTQAPIKYSKPQLLLPAK